MKKLRIYIAGPISKGDMLHNVRQADEAFFKLLKAGFAPWCPHWSVFAGSICRPYQFDGHEIAYASPCPPGTTHADWMGVDLPWVECADAVLGLPGESVEADAEVRHANTHGIPVFSTVEQVISWGEQYQREASERVESLKKVARTIWGNDPT